MRILHFADHQNTVFVAALVAALVGVVLVCLPVVLAPALRRLRGRGRALSLVAVAVGAVAFVVGGFEAGTGVRALDVQRQQVRSAIEQRYGIALDADQVSSLVDGGSPKKSLPRQAAAVGLTDPSAMHTLKLVADPLGSSDYVLTLGGRTLPTV